MNLKSIAAMAFVLTVPAFASMDVMMLNSTNTPSITGSYNYYTPGVPGSAVMLDQVPTSRWTYGCSATAAGMIFGYYDRHGYDNIYTGPCNGGVVPLRDMGAHCSLIATKKGFDGRTTRGHVDDYWISTGTWGADPWEAVGIEHQWGDCVADFLGTNQCKWDYDLDGVKEYNKDGATALWLLNSAEKLYDHVPSARYGGPRTSLTHGLKLFAESRGYDVLENYSQRIDTAYSGGFSFDNFMQEINNGCPVMIQLKGHSMVGVGYDEDDQTVYIHDTWSNRVREMTWGDSYAGMEHIAVTILHLADITTLTVPEPMTAGFLAIGCVPIFLCRRR